MNTSKNVAQTYGAVHFNYKKNEILSFRTAQMGTEIIMMSEIYQAQAEKYHTISHRIYKS